MLILSLPLALLLLLTTTPPYVTSSTYTIDPSKSLGLPFDGIGALSAGASSRLLPDYIEPYRSHILDYLFLPGFGASLHILKVEIGGDAQSTEGTEASHMHVEGEENYERGYEWWLMKEAKQRNPHIKLYGLSWAFPAFVMEGRKRGLPLTNSTVTYTINWLLAARDLHNLTIDYIGIWNERSYSADYILALRAALHSHNLSTMIVAADDCCSTKWQICTDMLADRTLSAAVDFIGGHYPAQATTANCSKLRQRKWSSEDFSSPYTAGGCWARLLNRNYVYGNFTATIAWSPIAAYYDELPFSRVGLMHAASPWSGHYDVDQVIWATAHTTHHTAIGWHYLGHGSGVGELTSGGTYVAYTDGQGQLTIVVESITRAQSDCNGGYEPGPTASQNITFSLAGSFQSIPSLHIFHSSFNLSHPIVTYLYEGIVELVNGSFTFTLLTDAVYTFSTINSTKGTHPPPPLSAPFPSPYTDTFDTPTLYSQPQYFTDQSGTFEWYQSGNASHGGVVRQSATAMPVPWCRGGDAVVAYSVMGNHSWQYIYEQVDVLIEERGVAMLAAAVSTGGCTGVDGSPAIAFAISSSGQWTLSNSTSLTHTVRSGNGTYRAGIWHHLSMGVGSDGLILVADGVLVDVVDKQDWLWSWTGWVGIGSSFDFVQFDNFEVEVVDAAVTRKEALATLLRTADGKAGSADDSSSRTHRHRTDTE